MNWLTLPSFIVTVGVLVVIHEFEKVVRSTFGNSADVLADFGLAPFKVPVTKTAEEKAVAAAKRVATRKARGTMSSKQKKEIKGSITAKLVVTPVTTSPASMPVATPAPVTSAPHAAAVFCVDALIFSQLVADVASLAHL